MQYLRQNTAKDIAVGPFVDATDGFTAEVGLALGTMKQTHIHKSGAAALTSISGNTMVHLATGIYRLSLNAADVDTLGPLVLFLNDAGVSRPVRHDFMVLPATIYDALVAGTVILPADATKVNGDAGAAANIAAGANSMVRGSIVAGSTTTALKTNLTEATNDHYNGRLIIFTSGALAGQAATIADYDGTAKQITTATLTDVPQSGDTFVIV